MRSKRYRVTVKAVDQAAAEIVVGTVFLDAADRATAERIGIEKLWTAELEQSGAKAAAHAERIAGEGG